jgi:hypothetical protein
MSIFRRKRARADEPPAPDTTANDRPVGTIEEQREAVARGRFKSAAAPRDAAHPNTATSVPPGAHRSSWLRERAKAADDRLTAHEREVLSKVEAPDPAPDHEAPRRERADHS